MHWYYSKNSTQLGPVGTEEIKAKLASGEISSADLVWRDGMIDWLPAGQVTDLQITTTPSAPGSIPPPGDGGVSPPVSPYTPPSFKPAPQIHPGGMMMPSTCGKATASMVLGICGIVFALCCPYIGIVLGILAVVFGNQAKGEIMRNPAWFNDLGKANGGVIMGWVSIGIGIAFGVLRIAFVTPFTSLQFGR